MADLNVFMLTNQELHKDSKDSKQTAKQPTVKVPAKKTVKESVKTRKASKRVKPFNIPANKLKLESLSWYLKEEEAGEETDITNDYTPDDEVVLVIDPEMDEVPNDLADAEEQAEELVGDHVCKCSICGANYVTDIDITEDMEVEDETCPVCGETGEQIVVGVITPTEELSSEDEEDVENADELDAEEAEDEIEVVDDEDEADADVEEDDDFEESVKRSRARTLRRKSESLRNRKPVARRPMKKFTEATKQDVTFDETTMNRMLTRFAKENYSNVKFVKITSGTVRGNRLTLEGTVTTTKGSKRSIKFISENFKQGKRMSLKFRENGPFTESVKNAGPTFFVECVMRGTTIVPVSLRYSYQAKNIGGSVTERKNTYSVTGKILSESVRRPVKARKATEGVKRTRKSRRTDK